MATYWENSCSFGLRYVSWYKYLIVSLFVFFLIAPFPDLCLLVPFYVRFHIFSWVWVTEWRPSWDISAHSAFDMFDLYKYLIVTLVSSPGIFFLIAPFPDHCLLVPFFIFQQINHKENANISFNLIFCMFNTFLLILNLSKDAVSPLTFFKPCCVSSTMSRLKSFRRPFSNRILPERPSKSI